MFNYLSGLKMIESVNALEFYEEKKTIKRSWKERLFSLPWNPWISTKIITVTKTRPAIWRVGNQIIYHPILKNKIMDSIIDTIVP